MSRGRLGSRVGVFFLERRVSLAQRMGYTPRHIRQVFAGRWRSIGRYEHVARTLSWSVEDALPELGVTPPRVTSPAAS